MPRSRSLSVRLSEEEFEWFRRKAHWENQSMSALLRQYVRYLIAEEGYLRPPDDEPQDFGVEKEMIQFILHVQNEDGGG